MVFLNYSTMEMVAKIVYYGPGLGGKTTNLKTIYQKTSAQCRGEMVSLATETDRTLFFDLLPMDVGLIAGFKAKSQLYTVPGQVFYNTTRKLVLRGVDGIVFVADSQVPMMDANRESFQNMRDNLAELNLTVNDIPIVIQYNKRDLPNVLSLDVLQKTLNPDGFPYVEASALKGIGVIETLREITLLTLTEINNRNLDKKRAEPKSAAKAVTPPAEALMPEASSFDEPAKPAKTPKAARDSFEQTLDNLDLDLSDDDDAFLEEDSLDMEDFDAWDEEDSLDNSLEVIGDDTSPGSKADDNTPADDSAEMRTLDFDALSESDSHELENILEVDDDLDLGDTLLAPPDEDASLEREVDAALRGGPSQTLDFMVETPWDAPDEIEVDEDLDFPSDLEAEAFEPDSDPSEALDFAAPLGADHELPLDELAQLEDDLQLDSSDDHLAYAGTEGDESYTQTPTGEPGLSDEDPFNFGGPSLELEPDLDDLESHLNGLEDSLAGLEDSITDLEPTPQLTSQDHFDPEEDGPSEFDFSAAEEELSQNTDWGNDDSASAYDFATDPEDGPELRAAHDEAISSEEPEGSAVFEVELDGVSEIDSEDLGIGDLDLDMDLESYIPSGELESDDELDSGDLSAFDVDSDPSETPEQAEPEQNLVPADEPKKAAAPMATKPVIERPAASPVIPTPTKTPEPDGPDLRRRAKGSSGLDELKRMTTRIQTTKIPRLKEANLDHLISDALGEREKKSKPDKFNLTLPSDFDKAQLNCVFVDEDGNVVHAELFHVNARKLEDGSYQLRVIIDVAVES